MGCAQGQFLSNTVTIGPVCGVGWTPNIQISVEHPWRIHYLFPNFGHLYVEYKDLHCTVYVSGIRIGEYIPVCSKWLRSMLHIVYFLHKWCWDYSFGPWLADHVKGIAYGDINLVSLLRTTIMSLTSTTSNHAITFLNCKDSSSVICYSVVPSNWKAEQENDAFWS